MDLEEQEEKKKKTIESNKFMEMLKKLLSVFMLSNNGGSGVTTDHVAAFESKVKNLNENLELMEKGFIKEGDPQSALFCRMKIEALKATVDTIRTTKSVDMSTIDINQYAAMVSNSYEEAINGVTEIFPTDTDEVKERKQKLLESKNDYEATPLSLQEKSKVINDFCSDALKGDPVAKYIGNILNQVDEVATKGILRTTSPAVDAGLEVDAQPKKVSDNDQEMSNKRLREVENEMVR